MYVWEEPLDREGDHTYCIDFTKEMANLVSSLVAIEYQLSAAATAAGLTYSDTAIVNDVASLKFQMPVLGDQTAVTPKGKPLEMEVKYTTAHGDIDAFTAGLHVKIK